MTSPFADLTTFERLREAALKGGGEYDRYRRREATEARRHVARVVELQLAARVQRMVEVTIASSKAVLLVGPPGTGKTEILEQIIDKIDNSPHMFGFTGDGVEAAWVTPEEEWSFESLVMGETVVGGELRTVEGDLLRAIGANQWLVLDETNRADMDRVLGGVLTWLSGKRVRVGMHRDPAGNAIPVYIDWVETPQSQRREVTTPQSIEYVAGSEWRLLGTYNAVDAQRVFRMGQALSRRFKHVPVPPASPNDFRKIIAAHIHDDGIRQWLEDRLTLVYTAHQLLEDAQLGPGLFVDMPRYVEKGLLMAALRSGSDGSSDFPGTPLDAAPAQDAPVPEVAEGMPEEHAAVLLAESVLDSGDGQPDDELREELLAESYLVSVGSFIAKFESDVLAELGHQLVGLGAFPQASWAWVDESLQSMRA